MIINIFTITSTTMLSILLGLILMVFSTTARADYLIPPSAGVFTEDCQVDCYAPKYKKAYPHKYKQHKILHHHTSRCRHSHEPVMFNYSLSCGHGRWVVDEYDFYNPDMSTGDDDAGMYPNMNINN